MAVSPAGAVAHSSSREVQLSCHGNGVSHLGSHFLGPQDTGLDSQALFLVPSFCVVSLRGLDFGPYSFPLPLPYLLPEHGRTPGSKAGLGPAPVQTLHQDRVTCLLMLAGLL